MKATIITTALAVLFAGCSALGQHIPSEKELEKLSDKELEKLSELSVPEGRGRPWRSGSGGVHQEADRRIHKGDRGWRTHHVHPV
jgi:hypothetical protein